MATSKNARRRAARRAMIVKQAAARLFKDLGEFFEVAREVENQRREAARRSWLKAIKPDLSKIPGFVLRFAKRILGIYERPDIRRSRQAFRRAAPCLATH